MKFYILFLYFIFLYGPTIKTLVEIFSIFFLDKYKVDYIYKIMPIVIEVIDERSKLEPLLPDLKMIVDDNGIVTLHEVDVI